jgi:hypothetical protein
MQLAALLLKKSARQLSEDDASGSSVVAVQAEDA